MASRFAVIVALTALTAVVGRQLAPRTPAADAQPGAAAAAKPEARPARPDGPPQYDGVIEQMKVYASPAPVGRPVVKVLLRDRRVKHIWVHLVDATLEQRGGYLETGSVASVWAKGPVARTDPPQVWAEYVICAPAGK